ncbi:MULTISPECIES: DUF1934 domain-containing protein [unclassified Fusibacter]|uniref:DUF1934 domain-containing protein n=1 Tax=unclassified Fusibacter TaxID=2624464 RepID=UPI0010123C67|nr:MULTISPECIES: DUF1934 domain-containing protein [unclassified Fusibacter]MCK8059301.1 DUF1934 domain-containing protein [Fusibacter sp. A2]NPE21235.1 DUF1934 domain-containing protein [Fusibacter sp. A1]RXV62502.1 DUF1934 domain-containing protein [Fusibacter sp. A1]
MRDITLQVKSVQKAMGEEPVEIDFITEGKLYLKGGATYLVYDETELSGLENHKTTLKIHDDKVQMKRFGENNSTMHFEMGLRETSNYETPYGVFKLEILTHRIEIDLGDTEGSVVVEYAISIHGLHEANHKLHIRYW